MPEEQNQEVSTKKKRGRPAKSESAANEQPVEKESTQQEEVTMTDALDISKSEDTIIDLQLDAPTPSEDVKVINDSDIFEVSEVEDNRINTLNYLFKRGETVWVANFGHKIESEAFGLIKDVYKYRPIKLTVKGFIYEDKIIYKFFGSSVIAEESHIKKTFTDCQALCDALNKV